MVYGIGAAVGAFIGGIAGACYACKKNQDCVGYVILGMIFGAIVVVVIICYLSTVSY